MSQPPLMGRGVPEHRRKTGVKVTCPMRGCDGLMYQLGEGELLQRSPRSGWVKVTRNCECPKCGHRQKIPVQVRAAEAESK